MVVVLVMEVVMWSLSMKEDTLQIFQITGMWMEKKQWPHKRRELLRIQDLALVKEEQISKFFKQSYGFVAFLNASIPINNDETHAL